MAEIRATVERNAADIGGAASALAKSAAEDALQTLRDEIDSVKITDLIVSLYLNENVKVYRNESRYVLVYYILVLVYLDLVHYIHSRD